MWFRRYRPQDHAACLEIFDGNCPVYFDVAERSDFEGFLQGQRHAYGVVESNTGAVIACGGYSRTHLPDYAHLRWGMVHRDYQHQGVGRYLLKMRLQEVSNDHSITLVKVFTSAQVKGFYEREGFVLQSILPGALGHGFDLCELNYHLSPALAAADPSADSQDPPRRG